MINGKKVIGICMTKAHSITRSDFLNRLHHIANKNGYKLIIFNSFVDFYNGDAFDDGAKAVYDIIDYNTIDAIVVHYDSFYNKSVADEIVEKAKANTVPVVIINGENEGCWSIIDNYDDAFVALMTHVMMDHQIKDTFFIAGNKENDPDSDKRIACYKKALSHCGIEFDESRLAYGEYWNDPTSHIVYSLIQNGELPRAIFCANDNMAFAVCNELKLHGYSVPDDVIVTGFDGIPESEHFSPQLTTCCENIEHIAQLTVDTLNRIFDGEAPQKLFNQYTPRISESCGCSKLCSDDFRFVAAELHKTIHEMEVHEDFEYDWIDRMLYINEFSDLYDNLAGCMLENSYVCLNADFIASILESKQDNEHSRFADELIVIPSKYSVGEAGTNGSMKLSDIVPHVDEWVNDNTTYIINSIYTGDEVCGYYAVKTDNVIYNKHKIKRVHKTINIAFTIAINHFKQDKLRLRIERASLTNPITGMANLKGAVKWFEEFGRNEANRGIPLSISVYGLPKYTYILENYGLGAAEEALRLASESLRMANPTDCFVAHIADDEFVVVNYYPDPNAIGDTIGKATSAFFSLIEGFNSTSGKEYFVEVNCGCIVLDPGWNGSLEGYIKFANSEMYMNRLKSGMGSTVKEESAPKDHYKMFSLLVEKNLFHYHFQPIVSAKTGDIYGYEALMRTDPSIGMNPLQVLDAAKHYGRMYDVEKATMFNVLERFAAEQESFGDRKLFINTTPGHLLNDSDIELFTAKYNSLLERCVYELTEQNTVSDEELGRLERLCNSTGNGTARSNIAIDDYGTGHSNIVNLMRYAPKVIKLDRFLITDIHKDQNKQMFVRSTIEFAKINGIMVLAEGVETSNELCTVIDLGVDLIQGYYTARPAPEPIPAIAEDIRREIIRANPIY